MIALNDTLLFQIIGFFVLLFILNRFLYGPVAKVLKEREERIDGTLKGAAETEKEVAAGLVDYEKRLKEAAVKGHEERGRLRQEALEKEKVILEAARAEAAEELSGIRGELEKSRAGALSSLKEEAKGLSRSIAEKILDRKVVIFLVAFALPLMPVLAHAAEKAEEGGSAWRIINFVILAVAIYLVWTKVVRGLLETRSTEIKKAIDEAHVAKETADAKAAEYKEKLAMLDARVAELHEELKAEGEIEQKRIIAEAEAAAVNVREQAKLAAEQEIKKARLEIRKEVAGMAVAMAEEILGNELKPEDQARLVKGYIDNLRLN